MTGPEASSLRAGCLFSGMGGFASGLRLAGFDLAWATDVDRHASKTFRHRFPGVRFVERDVRQLAVHADALDQVDVVAGGFPCQSFSQAGSRTGFADPRGSLFFELIRILKEYSPQDRPRLLVLENVPHLLSGAEGAWFDRIRREIRQAGYWFRAKSCWAVNVKDATDIPQNRERLFMVAASRVHFEFNPIRWSNLPPPPPTSHSFPSPSPSLQWRMRNLLQSWQLLKTSSLLQKRKSFAYKRYK